MLTHRQGSSIDRHQMVAPLLCAMVFCYRVVVLCFSDMNMHFDEAQYWLWSHHLDWGYFSKPPMISWAIFLFRSLFGETSLVLKFLPLMVYPLISWVIYATCRIHYDRSVAWGATLLFFTMPAVSLSSFLVTTDAFLLLFWSLALWQLVKALQYGGHHWLCAGIFSGCGLMSKYTMILFLPSFFLHAVITGRWREQMKQREVWLAMALAVCVWLPNLIWNFSHDMVSFGHVYEISQVENTRWHFSELLSFVGAQFGVFGLVSFGLLLRCFWGVGRFSQPDHWLSLWKSFFVVFFVVICIQAFLSRAFANWAAPAYVSGCIWLSVVLFQNKKQHWLAVAISVNLLTMGLMYHFETVYTRMGIVLSRQNDPMHMVRGWRDLGAQVSLVVNAYPDHIILTENRKILSELIFYVQPHPFNAQLFNPKHARQNYFHQTQDLNQYITRSFLWISAHQSTQVLRPYFQVIELVETLRIPDYGQNMKVYYVYRLGGFRGY